MQLLQAILHVASIEENYLRRKEVGSFQLFLLRAIFFKNADVRWWMSHLICKKLHAIIAWCISPLSESFSNWAEFGAYF